jgi:hypothetical protein
MMKVKQLLKNKKKTAIFGIATVCLVALGGGGYYLSQQKSEELDTPNSENSQTTQDMQAQESLPGKENTSASQTNSANPATGTTTTPSTTTTTLNDVSLQAIKSSDGAITLSLYGSQGSYDVEKCTNYQSSKCLVAWSVVVSNKTYEGHGGLFVDTMGVSEAKATYIAYSIVNGKRIGTSRPLTVNRDSFQDITTITGS